MINMTRLVFLLFGLCLVSTSLAITLTECELIYELRSLGIPEDLMKDFVCLVDAESSFQTHVKGGPNSDGSYDYGLFQINDHYWCNSDDFPGKSCNVRCVDLLSDDIEASVACAKIVLAQHGIEAWTGWVKKCKGKKLPEVTC